MDKKGTLQQGQGQCDYAAVGPMERDFGGTFGTLSGRAGEIVAGGRKWNIIVNKVTSIVFHLVCAYICILTISPSPLLEESRESGLSW